MSELLRFATAGSVDDGKSTLIGRLLYDSKAIFEDQMEAVERSSEAMGSEHTNLALLTDGLRAEREQGITIDVAYRYFATPRRKFIIADTPGHIQYTRNMVTGASTADLALVLVDARKGLVEQSRRHAFLASLLRIPHLVLCVNKMDLVDWDQERFEEIKAEFRSFAAKLDITDLTFVPVSALHGDNVVTRSANTPWYEGSSLLHHLEEVHIASDRNLIDVRFPVQYVIRPHNDEFHDYRGYAGQVAGLKRGISIKNGQFVVVRDEVKTREKPAVMRWNLLTPATVRIVDGKTVELSQHGKKMLLIFETHVKIDIKTWPTDPTHDYDAPNPGTTFVGFEAKLSAGSRHSFTAYLSASADVAPVKPLAEWPVKPLQK